MRDRFESELFLLEHIESEVDIPVVWEKHCHTQYEMIYVLEGDISIMLEGRNYRLTENQTVIIPPLFYHTVTANKKGIYRRVTALFETDAIPPVLQPLMQKKNACLTVFSSRHGEELKRLCRESNSAFYAPLLQSLMVQLMYHDIQAEQTESVVETDEFLQKIISYIDEHLSEKITLGDLAVYTSRSKSSVCHLFEQKMNISPKQYILQKKLALAHRWIDDGMSPTLAALQIGYENYSNFYRMYRNMFQISPSQIQREGNREK